MNMTVRASASVKAVSMRPRTQVRPCASLSQAQIVKAVALGTASMALVASVVAPAEAHNLISTVASAAEGYPFVPPSWAPSVLVPITGLVIPAIVFATLFVYIEKEAPPQ
ncbi:MAG: hypothetical protein WDW38_001557 [Sanguina aurantia]